MSIALKRKHTLKLVERTMVSFAGERVDEILMNISDILEHDQIGRAHV